MSLEIIILTKNRLPLLKEALESVLKQALSPFRITIVDNASSDGTATYVRELIKKHKNMFLLSQPEPVSFAQNVKSAIDCVAADYFMLMHDDDLLSPYFVQSVINAIKAAPDASLISVGHQVFTDKPAGGECCPHNISVQLYKSSVDFAVSDMIRFVLRQVTSMCFPAIVYRRDCVSKDGPDMDSYGKICDKPFVYASMGKGPVIHIVEPLYCYRVHTMQDTANSSNGPYPNEILNFLNVHKRLFSSNHDSRKVYYALSVMWMKSLFFWGENPENEWSKWFREAKRRGLVHGLFSKPWRILLWKFVNKCVALRYLKKHRPDTLSISIGGDK
jgi:glycosyltransferase involved in cell wall biosynthesis